MLRKLFIRDRYTERHTTSEGGVCLSVFNACSSWKPIALHSKGVYDLTKQKGPSFITLVAWPLHRDPHCIFLFTLSFTFSVWVSAPPPQSFGGWSVGSFTVTFWSRRVSNLLQISALINEKTIPGRSLRHMTILSQLPDKRWGRNNFLLQVDKVQW